MRDLLVGSWRCSCCQQPRSEEKANSQTYKITHSPTGAILSTPGCLRCETHPLKCPIRRDYITVLTIAGNARDKREHSCFCHFNQ
ncbi:hypothetical protein AOLI_G00278740 [Acnodon oligacanthus]